MHDKTKEHADDGAMASGGVPLPESVRRLLGQQ